jgi:4-amino-4-deoxy-L-arabinose transferase-like glycosyltransferase
VALDSFPIYFFTDEAVHSILAESLITNGFRYQDVLLPTFFPLGASFGLNSITVYLNIIPVFFFGKSIFVARATAVLISFLGAIAVGLILKDIFKLSYWWVATLLLSITPTWFLHSRTAFENVAVASFYACFLYLYLRYRTISPNNLYAAILFGGLCFYAHGLGQFLMAITAFLLFFSDLRYHWQNRKVVLIGIGLMVFLAIPYIRYVSSDTAMFSDQLRMRASYWLDSSLNNWDKLIHFIQEYAYGLNPVYWFSPQPPRDLVRHIMKGYGHLLLPSLVFVCWGLYLVMRHIRKSAYRTVFLVLLAAPFGAAMAQVTILRTIWIVVPVTILAGLSLVAFLELFESKGISRYLLAIISFSVLVGINLFMLWDSTKHGPLWYRDYTLYGMQYGAKQLFGEAIPDLLESDKEVKVVVSPTWANGTDNYVSFFLNAEQTARVTLNSIDAYMFKKLPVDENLILVLTKDEYNRARVSDKFGDVHIKQVVQYPDGSPGFYFVNLAYADDVDEIRNPK